MCLACVRPRFDPRYHGGREKEVRVSPCQALQQAVEMQSYWGSLRDYRA